MNISELIQLQSPIRRKDNGWLVYFCPFCEDETGHLHLNKRLNFWHCFKCAEHGKVDITSSLIEIEGINLDGQHNLGTYTFKEILKLYKFTPLLEDDGISTQLIIDNMFSRGMTEADIVKYGVSVCDVYPYEGRAVIFWYPQPGKPKYMVARRVTSGPPKYMNPVVKKDFIWTFFDLDNVPKRMAITEGFFDGHNTNRVCPSASLLGKTMNSAQINFMWKLRNKGLQEVVILLDKAGIRKLNVQGKRIKNELDATMKLYNQLKDMFYVRPLFLEGYDDPGSADINYLSNLIHS